jgi:hypothetical protein
LFTLERGAPTWSVTRANLLGDNVTLVMHDPRDAALYASQRSGVCPLAEIGPARNGRN